MVWLPEPSEQLQLSVAQGPSAIRDPLLQNVDEGPIEHLKLLQALVVQLVAIQVVFLDGCDTEH